jgi:hypothetical protein
VLSASPGATLARARDADVTLGRGLRALLGARRPRPLAARLYVRPRCGLCEEAAVLLQPFERAGRLQIEPVDITRDEGLFRRYCFTIPVLELEGGPALEWPFDRRQVARSLR